MRLGARRPEELCCVALGFGADLVGHRPRLAQDAADLLPEARLRR